MKAQKALITAQIVEVSIQQEPVCQIPNDFFGSDPDPAFRIITNPYRDRI